MTLNILTKNVISNISSQLDDSVKDRNHRAATLTSNGERPISLQTLQNHFPSLENRMPRTDNTSHRRLIEGDPLLYRPHEPPNNSSSYDNGFNANGNPLDISNNNNVRPSKVENRQIQSNLNHAIDQPSSKSVQQLRYPSDRTSADYGTPASNAGFNNQHSVNQFNVGRTVNEDSHSLFSYDNSSGVHCLILPPLNIQTTTLPNGTVSFNKHHLQPVTAPSLSNVGPELQNVPVQGQQTQHNMSSAITTGVYSIPFFSKKLYPEITTTTATTYSNSPYETDRTFQNVPPKTFPTASSTNDTSISNHNRCPIPGHEHSAVCPCSSVGETSTPSKHWTTFPFPRQLEAKADDVPGLYERVGIGKKKIWRCTYNGCGLVTRGIRDRTRHIGTHARQEEKLIEDGRLKPENAIAIPRAKLLTYECEDPDCRYLHEEGRPYTAQDYRVDFLREVHIRNYHDGRVTPESEAEEEE